MLLMQLPVSSLADSPHISVTDPYPVSTLTGRLEQIPLSTVFTDADGHELTYELLGEHGEHTKIVNGIFYFSEAAAGTYELTVNAVCASGETASADFTFNVQLAQDDGVTGYGYDETPADEVTVRVTYSFGSTPLLGNDDDQTVLAGLEVTVPYFDLALYGLEQYYRLHELAGGAYDPDSELIERPTALHLFIYMLERYAMGLPEEECCCGLSDLSTICVPPTDFNGETVPGFYGPAFECTGPSNGVYITSYWGHVTDFNYYRNHAYPLKSPGVGSTCDYMLLSDGDLIEVGFFGDPTGWTRAAFTMFDEDSYEVEAGDVLLFTAAKRSTNENYSNQAEPTTEIDAYLYDSDWNPVAQAELEDDIYWIELPEDLPGGQYTLMGQDPAGAMYPATAQVTVIGQEAPPTEDPVDITVRVSVSNCGQIEEDLNGEPMALREVALTGKAHYTLDDVFTAAHDLYYAGGAAAGYASYETSWGTSVAKFWGDESGYISYQINKGTVNVMSADDEVQDGDEIDAYILQSAYPDTEAYAAFDHSDIDAGSMEPFDLTLTQAVYDENFNMVFVPCADAVITVDGEETDYVTAVYRSQSKRTARI